MYMCMGVGDYIGKPVSHWEVELSKSERSSPGSILGSLHSTWNTHLPFFGVGTPIYLPPNDHRVILIIDHFEKYVGVWQAHNCFVQMWAELPFFSFCGAFGNDQS